MINETRVTDIDQIDLPYGHTVKLTEVEYENGMQVLRMKFRENKRFTVLDIDPTRAEIFGNALIEWAKNSNQPDSQAESEAE